MPVGFSAVVRELRARNLLHAVVSAGNCFGGDVETPNVYSGLIAASGMVPAPDLILARIGPGAVGTSSPCGHGGISAAVSPRAEPVLAPLVSFADSRETFGESLTTRKPCSGQRWSAVGSAILASADNVSTGGWIRGALRVNLREYGTWIRRGSRILRRGVGGARARRICRGVALRVGVVRELTPGESRVALDPYAVNELTKVGHRVLVQSGAGKRSAISDEEYRNAGAQMVERGGKVFRDSELIVKVYGPVAEEFGYLREDLILLSFLALPVNPTLMRALLDSRCTAIASESIQDERGKLPVLAPMSEIAGRLAPQIGARYLQHHEGGRGILLGGSAGVRPGRVVILGCGIVGAAAARVSSGLGAQVTVVDRDLDRLRRLEEAGLGGVSTLAASSLGIREAALEADLLIGAVLVVGAKTPALVDRATVREMKRGSVIVDMDVDQGGCVETSKTTTLRDPTFVEEGVIHYCVKNVPAAVPVTATSAFSNALLPLVRRISGHGLPDALKTDSALRNGVAVAEGRVVSKPLARAHGMEDHSISSILPLNSEMP